MRDLQGCDLPCFVSFHDIATDHRDGHEAFELRIPFVVDRQDIQVGKYGTHSPGRI
jgi:hypothetical protein